VAQQGITCASLNLFHPRNFRSFIKHIQRTQSGSYRQRHRVKEREDKIKQRYILKLKEREDEMKKTHTQTNRERGRKKTDEDTD
jgi:hypothetical protein